MEFGNIISALRAERGIYQKELADHLKVSIGTISNYEQGIHSPDFETLCKLADYYNVSVDYLLGRTTFRTSLNELNRPLTKTYTVADLLNTTLELDSVSARSLVEYLDLLKLKQAHQDGKR
ncbi:MAG: helix-turn-helix domain-containing protein [Clostridium sp.]|nr:helix-turn-helix domain-containing protein [Acetatifactor muris]MCM1526736.1 helix-turn-helix domain-containing protein [Bacteroides sp.]MCM1562804.1 helix-turn-helix domain-containing protein [Clostridium sp.]